MSSDQRKVVFICSPSRSGSTALDLMLGNAPGAFSCGEVYAVFRPWRPQHMEPRCGCGDPECAIWAHLRHATEAGFHHAAMQFTGSDTLIDSSKNINWVIDAWSWIRRHDMRPHAILLWKTPVELAYSFWKRGHGLYGWRRYYVRYYSRFLQTGIPFVSLSHARLVDDPSGTLQYLSEHLGLPYEAGQHVLGGKTFHHVFGSASVERHDDGGEEAAVNRQHFDAEFEQQLGSLHAFIAGDRQVSAIRDRLADADDAFFKGAWQDAPVDTQISKPFWYYFNHLRSLEKRWSITRRHARAAGTVRIDASGGAPK